MSERKEVRAIIEQALAQDRDQRPAPLAKNEQRHHQIGSDRISLNGATDTAANPFVIYQGDYGRWTASIDKERIFIAGPYPLPPLDYQD
jgi:hypothetical protein